MRIDIEEIQELREKLRAFNRLSIFNLEFYENGKEIDIPPYIKRRWDFIGLNNADFIDTRFWEAEIDTRFWEAENRSQPECENISLSPDLLAKIDSGETMED